MEAIRLIVGILLTCALIAAAVICAMKGKWVFFVVGWFSGIFWIIGALRLAKPWSWWARRRYGDVDMERAQERFARPPSAHRRGLLITALALLVLADLAIVPIALVLLLGALLGLRGDVPAALFVLVAGTGLVWLTIRVSHAVG
jgi:hypothetical protein